MKVFSFSIILLFFQFIAAAQYNYYFGNIHAHTDFSDGNQDLLNGINTPQESFEYAKASDNFDFLGISEHNHSDAKARKVEPKPDDVTITPQIYRQGVGEAAASTVNDSFVALYGMEYGINSKGGHVLIYGVDSLIGWEDDNFDIFNEIDDYTSLFYAVADRPNSFAYLAHPKTKQFDNLVDEPYDPVIDRAVVGVAFRSGPSKSEVDDYSERPSRDYYGGYYLRVLGAGYHLAPGSDHDNHFTNFGRTTQTRLVILSDSLTTEGVFDAFKNRRFYASDDWNAKASFTCLDTFQMGSIVIGNENPKFEFSIVDEDANDDVEKIEIYRGIAGDGNKPKVIGTILELNNFCSEFIQDSDGQEYVYIVKVFQEDGDIIWTAPIWFTKN